MVKRKLAMRVNFGGIKDKLFSKESTKVTISVKETVLKEILNLGKHNESLY
jgi:hypothetical protein